MAAPSLTDRLFDDADSAPLDPFDLFEDWLSAARESEPNDPTAMAVATVDGEGMPDVRMALLNARDRRGFVFFTNLDSAKGEQLAADPRAALLFHWKSLRRQVRIRGAAERVTDPEADAYFATRPRQSQLGAHASRQSRPLAGRAELVAAVQALDAEIGTAKVPRPARWSGFRVIPRTMEFWKDGAFRLHDRVRFTRSEAEDHWTRQRLYP
jgi:pyridoxamine 5'-phosphate oxidase